MTDQNKKVGVFVCKCGTNIAGTVDVDAVVKKVSRLPDVTVCKDYIYLCSEPGQAIIKEDIQQQKLDAVVVAACSPRLHEHTFRRLLENAGLNPYCLEIANIREQCSWVHSDSSAATEKAIAIVKTAVTKVVLSKPLTKLSLGKPVKAAAVIGGGIAGIQAALDIAQQGFKVYLIERSPTIGGNMAKLDKTFPTLDCSSCILTPKMVDVLRNEKIELLTNADLLEVDGVVGNFKIKLLKRPRYVRDGCTACGLCAANCRLKNRVENEFDLGLGKRSAIYIPFPQAVPQKYVIDENACLFLRMGKCGKKPACEEVCPADAIDFSQKPETIEINVGAIVVATGYKLLDKSVIAEYGSGKYKNVIDSLQFERLLSSTGPTGGELLLSNRVPKEIVFIQCVGSRDEQHLPYCSKICCMYTAKHALLYKQKVPDGQVYVFYIDVRAGGKGYEEFVQKVAADKALYLRGKVSKLFPSPDNSKIVVWGVDTLSNKKIELYADLVVLAPAIVPQTESKEIAQKLRISCDEYGFLAEAHPKLRPVDTHTDGIFIAGCCQSPKDIPETVAQASAAAARAAGVLVQDTIDLEPLVAEVIDENCDGCAYCVEPCPYKAVSLIEYAYDGGVKKTIDVNAALCKGCGVCQATCPKNGVVVCNFTLSQFSAMIGSIIGG